MKIIHKPYNKIRTQKSYSFCKKIIIIIIKNSSLHIQKAHQNQIKVQAKDERKRE
jgi:uncharacterized ubiquitin-like protein YukD